MRWHPRYLLALALVVLAVLAGALRYRARSRAPAAECPEARALTPACGACVAGACCAEISACYTSAACIDLNDCSVTCGEDDEGPKVPPAECRAACERARPAAVAIFHAWDECARDRCGKVCPRGDDREER